MTRGLFTEIHVFGFLYNAGNISIRAERDTHPALYLEGFQKREVEREEK